MSVQDPGEERRSCTRQEYKRACAPIYTPEVPGWNTEDYIRALPEKLAKVPYPERAAHFARLLECPEMRICHARSGRHEGLNTTDKLHKDTIDRLVGSLKAYKKMADTPVPSDPRLEQTIERLKREADNLRVVDSRPHSRSTTPTQSPRSSTNSGLESLLDRTWSLYGDKESENSDTPLKKPSPPDKNRPPTLPRPHFKKTPPPQPRPPLQPRPQNGRPPPAPKPLRV